MSIKKALVGLGGVGAVSVGALFGISKKQEEDKYRAKITRYRATAARANKHLIDRLYVKLADPESKGWSDKFNSYKADGFQYGRKSWEETFPKGSQASVEALRDFCFEKAEENMSDVDEDKVNIDNGIIAGKEFWDMCTSPK
ncbi:hypothetical protein MHF_0558 [Mycoplasma haemofelis Ohio2]|uniref:Uncharacterized protein n=1 Tax=Mycoplasma haemofelis (strain Ohio2) TaxID=859194 RepID=F6FHY2_MYCHI|nr:hypothetical protein MHF_0558 [Mycoplasma haemofelis Ohio2]